MRYEPQIAQIIHNYAINAHGLSNNTLKLAEYIKYPGAVMHFTKNNCPGCIAYFP